VEQIGMSPALAVAKRELRAFFTTPIGYIVVGGYALISGLGFTASFLFYARMTQSPSNYGYSAVPSFEESFLSPFLAYCGLLFMFIGPLLTMRLFAEERNQGTIELLFTHPLRDRDIIGGKFLAGLALVGVMVLNLAVYVFLIYRYTDVEVSVLLLGLLSVLLMGAAILSVGVFISARCSNQITAALLTFSVLFLMFILGYFGGELSEDNPAPAAWPEDSRAAAGSAYTAFRTIAKQLPVESHAAELAQGILDPADIAYYVLFVAFFLFLTFRALESRRWRV
jgi:ABC-2 type transport system permease protein